MNNCLFGQRRMPRVKTATQQVPPRERLRNGQLLLHRVPAHLPRKPQAGLSPVADTWRTSGGLLAEGGAPSLLLWHPRETQALA